MSLWNKKNETTNAADAEQSKKEMDALLDAFSAKVDEKLKPLSETVTTLKGKFDAIENAASAENAEAERRAAEAENAERTPEEKTQEALKASLALAVQTNARITENECILSVQNQFPDLVTELRQLFANTSVDIKANPKYGQMCQNAVDQLVGREARKGGLRYNKESKTFLIEDGASGGTGDGSPLISGDFDWTNPMNPNQKLTGLQQLAKIGLTAKDYEEMQKNGLVQ